MLDVPPIWTTATPQWAVFLGIEGVLLDAAVGSDTVVIPPELPALLSRVHRRLSGACVLVSGRDLDYIDTKLNWRLRDAAGCHGGQLRFSNLISSPKVDVDLLGPLTRRLIAEIRRFPGALVEIKAQSVALYFGASSLTGATVAHLLERACAYECGLFQTRPIRNGVELVPREVDRGRAIAFFMEKARYLGLRPVFAGGGSTDEAAFKEVNRRGGISILVGDRPGSCARYNLRAPAQLRDWLEQLVPSSVLRLSIAE